MDEWVGEIVFSPEVETKIRQRPGGGLTPDQVREAVALGAHDEARWDDDPKYGSRLMLVGADAESSLIAYLRPLDRSDGRWECLTAWRI